MRFSSQFLFPIISMVVASVISLCAILFLLTSVQDRMETERQAQAAALTLKAKIDMVNATVLDYSNWDDAVRNVSLGWNETWLADNLNSSTYANFQYEYLMILDSEGSARYTVIDGKRSNLAQPFTELGSGFERGVRLLENAHSSHPVGGVTQTRRGPAVFSVAWVAPVEGSDLPFRANRLLVMVKMIDKEMLTEMRDAVVGTVRANAPQVYLSDDKWLLAEFGSTNTLDLPWTASHPGTELFNRFQPWIILISLALIGLGSFVLVRARTATRELIASEMRTRRLASRDALTGLPNRRAITDHLIKLNRDKADYAILYMDLDGFKPVNDCFGHSAGDMLLRKTGERLRRTLPADVKLSRLGGDEFAIIVHNPPAPGLLEKLASEIIDAVREPYEIGAGPIEIGASIGIALCENFGHEEVLRRADVAMYAAKVLGRNNWRMFDETLNSGQKERQHLEIEIKRAIVENEIDVAYQPIVRAQDEHIVTVEALARWTHKQRGVVAPEIFISVAEETGAIIDLGWTILRQACTAARGWPCKLAINLSPAQFCQNNFVGKLLQTLAECDFPPSRLEFEITETYLLKNPEIAVDIIASLRRHGITIALDDFGTGYASIGYLQRFELDLVKLDKSFVEDIAISPDAAQIAQAIIALGTALKLPIVAEGVETAAQATILTIAGCSRMQGWHYGRPVAADEMAEILSGLAPKRNAA